MANKLLLKLKKLNKVYQDVKEEVGDDTGGFSTIPAGKYLVGEVQCELGESKNGNLMIFRKQKILDGSLEGKVVSDSMNIESERGPEFLIKWFNLIGAQCDDLEKLEDTLEEINKNVGGQYKVTVKDDGQYNNVYYNEVVEYGNFDYESDEEEDEEEGDIDLSVMSRTELKAFITENELDIKVIKKDSDDDIRKKIKDALEEEEEEEPEEEEEDDEEEEEETPPPSKKKAKKVPPKKVEEEEEEDDEEEEEESDSQLDDLKTLAEDYGITFKSNVTLEALTKQIASYNWRKKEMTADEVKLLKALKIPVK